MPAGPAAASRGICDSCTSRAAPGCRSRSRGTRTTSPCAWWRGARCAHQPAQAVLARAGDHQGRSASVLRRRRAGAAAAPARSGDGDEALPARRGGRVLLHEARAVAAPRLDRDLLDRARLGERHRLPDDPGPGVAALGDQPRLHRPQPVVRALRRRRPPRLPALRSRSGARARRSRRCSRPRWSCARRSTALGMPSSRRRPARRGIHVYVPIVRGPTQKEVWTFAKALAQTWHARHPKLITAEYRIAKRPHGRVLVDYNQNAWGRTLASVYSVRPRPRAPVSMPVTWEEIERGVDDRGLPHRQRPGAHRRGRGSLGRGHVGASKRALRAGPYSRLTEHWFRLRFRCREAGPASSNPPNPWSTTDVEYLEEPPPEARLEVYEDHTRDDPVEERQPRRRLHAAASTRTAAASTRCAYCYARPTHEYLSFGAGHRLRPQDRRQAERARSCCARPSSRKSLEGRDRGLQRGHRLLPAARGVATG